MQKFTAMLWGVALAVLAVGGVGFGISYWFESRFGSSSVLMFWGSIGFCIALFVGVLIAGMIQRWTINGMVDFQAADDRGEIARRAVEKEKIKGANRYDQDVRRAAIVLAKSQAHAIVERGRLEDTRRQLAISVADDWYALPDNADVERPRLDTTAADNWYALPDNAGMEANDDDEEWR